MRGEKGEQNWVKTNLKRLTKLLRPIMLICSANAVNQKEGPGDALKLHGPIYKRRPVLQDPKALASQMQNVVLGVCRAQHPF